jgi:hypothetical protein
MLRSFSIARLEGFLTAALRGSLLEDDGTPAAMAPE